MVEFGVLSSVFDFLTFGALLWLFDAAPQLFRTGWFVESLLTELVDRARCAHAAPVLPEPARHAAVDVTAAIIALTFAIPFLPFAGVLGFAVLPTTVLLTLIGITVLYIGAVELAKAWFYRRRP